MTLELTKAAVADLRSIRAYTADQWGPEQEGRYLDGLWEKFQEAASSPERFRSRDDLFPGCRIAAQGKHVILFRAQGDTLQIVRILHGAMDYPRHLGKPRKRG